MKKLALRAAIFILVALLFTPIAALAAGSAQLTRTFQPSTIDSYISLKKTASNFGSVATMNVQSSSGGQLDHRSVVQFDFSQIPTGSTVSSATLSLYASAVPAATRTDYAHRITTNWAEGTVTWNTPWATPGGDYAASTVTATTPAAAGWMDFTVTDDVAAFVAGTYSNYGWLIKDGTESSATPYLTTFYTKEEATQTTLRPKLALTFTPVWESYSDTGRTTVPSGDTFTGSDDTVYMGGTGLLDGAQTYNVGYYDGGGTKITTDAGIALVNVVSDRGDLGNTADPWEPTYTFTTNPTAQQGLWHALVQPTGATTFDTSYSTVSAAPDTYGLIADDNFTVNQDVIPEFSTVMAAIGVAGMCFGIYWWMRKRAKLRAG